MKFRSAVLLHLNTSFWTLAPAALLILAPAGVWGWLLRALAIAWVVGAVMALMRGEQMGIPGFFGSTGGYILSIPLFALALWLDPGWPRTVAAMTFMFFNGTSFLIYKNGMEKALDAQRVQSPSGH